MGWSVCPVGNSPVAQMAKGIIPCIGEWIANAAKQCLQSHWGTDDWEYIKGEKKLATNKIEKEFRLE